MSYIEITRRGRVLEVTLNKPKVNAIDIEMSRDMGRAFAELREDPELWCAILTGAGDKVFFAAPAGPHPA
jgi:crotonobetainyl-CoA hydratase